MHVPFIDLNPTIHMVKAAVSKRWESALARGEFVGGPAVSELEERLSRYLGVENVIGCASGTDALIVALQALGVRPGMKVAMPNLTFWAPYEAIVQVGAIPVLIDIDRGDLQMCYREFCEAYEQYRFEAAILVHLYGWTSSHLTEFREFSRQHGIALLEDGAQAFGVTVGGKPLFSQATIGTLSFYPAKVFGGSGDGGAMTTSDPKLAATCRALCNHGRAGHYTYDYVGWNSRLGGLQADYLNEVYLYIDDIIRQRKAALEFYREFFAPYEEYMELFLPPHGVEGNGYLAVLMVKNRSGDDVAAELKKRHIGCARTYPVPIDQQPPARNALRVSALEVSHLICRNIVNLPLFYGISEEQCKQSGTAFLAALRPQRKRSKVSTLEGEFC